MYLFYSLLLTVGVLLLLPRFLYKAARHGKYAAGFGERAGRLPPVVGGAAAAVPPHVEGRPVIWVHCVSVGETHAARPLLHRLRECYPSHALAISTTTLAGQQLARRLYGELATRVFYFPFDWAWTVRRTLRAIAPAAVLVMETELWPHFLRECRRRGVPVALVNGRISGKSFRRYRFGRRFISRVVGDLTLAIMQTDMDAERIGALGLARERIRVSGNIKFDVEPETGDHSLADEFRTRFQIDERRPLLVAASTHAPEERVVIEAFGRVREAKRDAGLRLLIAPRHPERFAEVASLLETSGLRWVRRSAPPAADDVRCDAILLDTIGELSRVYHLAALVFVGGSIARIGGHNVLEPAGAAKCIITGAHTANFISIVREFLEQDAIIQLPPLVEAEAPSALARTITELLSDDERRRQLGGNARRALEQSRGATFRTVEMLAPLLQQKQTSEADRRGCDAPPRS